MDSRLQVKMNSTNLNSAEQEEPALAGQGQKLAGLGNLLFGINFSATLRDQYSLLFFFMLVSTAFHLVGYFGGSR